MSFITKKRKKVNLEDEDEDIIENVGPFWKNILESGMFFLYSEHNEKNGRYVILCQFFVHNALKYFEKKQSRQKSSKYS